MTNSQARTGRSVARSNSWAAARFSSSARPSSVTWHTVRSSGAGEQDVLARVAVGAGEDGAQRLVPGDHVAERGA